MDAGDNNVITDLQDQLLESTQHKTKLEQSIKSL